MTKIGIPKEIHDGEKRVAATPDIVFKMRKLGFDVLVESGAGASVDSSDAEFREAGAAITDGKNLWKESDIVVKVRPPEPKEIDMMRDGGWLVGFIYPGQNRQIVDKLAKKRATVFAMDSIPRITRAQKMDVLSAMANIAGYRAVIEAAAHFPRFFTGQITAAGKIDPAKVLVIGAGVAGLSAIGAAKALGAIVRAFDPRSATKDQVASMGAEFLELDVKEEGEGKGGYAKEMSDSFLNAEMALFAQQAMQVDIIITTALIPGKPAPKLITQGMVESMKPGSVIVDLAAEQGGNCALTEPGKVVDHKGVKIVGYTDLPSRMASMSSRLYGSCVAAFLEELGRSEDTPVRMSAKHEQEPRSEDSPSVTGSTPSLAGGTGDADKSVLAPLSSSDRRSDDHEDKSVLAPLPQIDLENEVVRGAVVLDHGKMLWPPPVREMPPPPEPGGSGKDVVQPVKTDAHGQADGKGLNPLVLVGLGVLLLLIGIYVPESKLSHFTVFMLAVFVGFQVVWNVKPALHTPLMSVTNAISGIILVGGMLQLSGELTITTILGAVAVLIATINIAGGFLVTNRMLAMFRK